MKKTKVNYRLVRRIKDESKFKVEQLEQYALALQVSYADFKFCISEVNSNQCLLLEHYKIDGVDTTSQLINALENIYEEHHLLTAGFWKSVKIVIKNQQFTFIPNSLFDKKEKTSYLINNVHVNTDTQDVHYYKQIKFNAVTVFAVEKALTAWFDSVYPTLSIQIAHQASVLTEGILHYKDHTHLKTMFMLLDGEHVNIGVAENRKLLYHNRFQYKTNADLVRYTTMVLNEMKMDPDNAKVLVWGSVDSESSSFKELYKYIRNISFGGKPGFMKFSYMFDEAPDQQYFDLYSTVVCE